MKEKNLDRIISIIKEQMVANAPGTQGGFGDSADPKGPVAGRSKKIYMKGRRKPWLDYLRTSNGRRS